MLKKIAIYLFRIVGVIIGLVFLIWLVLLAYVALNEEKLTRIVSDRIQNRIKGDVEIGGLSVGFFRTFPLLSLQLKEVVVRDSLYAQSHIDLLNAGNIYLRASIPGLITGSQPVGKVIIRDGSINLFTDFAGSTNEYVLKSDGEARKKKDFSMPDVELKNVAVTLENRKRKKYYRAIIAALDCTPRERKQRLLFDLNVKMTVKNIAFNTKTGSYLRDKPFRGKFRLEYASDTKELIVDNIKIYLDGHPFYFDGNFCLDKDSTDFRLAISAKKVMYSKAASFLREPLEKKLNEYSISKPINLDVQVSGKTSGNSMPLIQVALDVENSRVGTPIGAFDNCNFKGSYNNEMVSGKGRTDENSLIHLKTFSGTWERIVLKSKDIRISNLVRPFLDCDIASDLDLKSLNSLTGSGTFEFIGGKSSINVFFKGSVMGDDSTASTINGDINIYKGSMRYLPRNFTLKECDATFKFVNNDLIVSRISAKAGKTQLNMKGSAKNFLSMLDVSADKLLLSWTISSPALYLEDFKPFLSRAEGAKSGAERKTKLGATASKIDRLFSEGDMYVNFSTPVMEYKTFRATNVQAEVVMKTTEIAFQKVKLNHAGGTMLVNGSLINGKEFNPVTLNTEMTRMDIPELFAAFENFGQDAITHQNLNGKLSASVDFKTAVNNQAQLISTANAGTIMFLLEGGELNKFEPLIEISKKAFKKQDFTQVKFADLQNKLEVRGTTFILNPMDIRSTALNLTVEGIYDMKKGTDMSIRLPLTNLTKSQSETDITDGGKAKKGVSLRLRARTGDDGKLKVSWDPFKRSRKNREEVQDSTQALITE